jgi:hypothetical protein
LPIKKVKKQRLCNYLAVPLRVAVLVVANGYSSALLKGSPQQHRLNAVGPSHTTSLPSYAHQQQLAPLWPTTLGLSFSRAISLHSLHVFQTQALKRSPCALDHKKHTGGLFLGHVV